MTHFVGSSQVMLISFHADVFTLIVSCLRACSHGGGGPREGEVPHLPGVRKKIGLHIQPRGAGVRFKKLSRGR